jgi:hypothetical protein
MQIHETLDRVGPRSAALVYLEQRLRAPHEMDRSVRLFTVTIDPLQGGVEILQEVEVHLTVRTVDRQV